MPGGHRGPLSRALRELSGARMAAGRSVEPDEAVPIVEGMSRRRFLQLGLAAGAGMALAACTGDRPRSPPRPSPTEPRVVVVGAGLAGLTAAYWLAQAGVPARVFEAQDRVGGRCWTAREFAEGQIGEHGGEFIDTGHLHLRRLVRRLGLELDDLWTEGAGGRFLTFVDGAVVGRGTLSEELDGAVRSLVRTARANGSFLAGSATPEAEAFDRLSMAEWIDEHVPGGLASPAGRVLAAEQTAWWGSDPQDLSATNLIDFFAVRYPGADERYTVHGGLDQVPARLVEELPPGSVDLETPLTGLIRRSDGAVELRFEHREPVTADYVVLAIPFTTLRRVDLEGARFSEGTMAAIRELGMGTNAKVLLQFSEPFPMGTWSGGLQRGDDPNFQTWESGSTDGRSGRRLGLLTAFPGGKLGAGYGPAQPHAPAPRGVVDETLAAIEEAVPGTSARFNGRAWLDEWASDPWVEGSYAAFAPGQYTRFYGAMGRPEGSVHFAGEHTSTLSQGYLDGGVRTGARAAVEILDAIGVRTPPALTATIAAARRFRPRYPWDGRP
jgi:monoamine oxidase